MKMLSKLLILTMVSTFTASGYAGWFPWFSGNYDPYYGMKSEKCYRPAVKSDSCHCRNLRNVDTCQKVMSIQTFSKKEMMAMKKQHKHPKLCKTHVKFFKKHY